MKKNISKYLSLTVLILFAQCVMGCASIPEGHRFYPGPPQPSNQVALLYDAAGNCDIQSLLPEKEREEKYFNKRILELLPGQYTIGIRYYTPSASEIGDKVKVNLNVRAGNIYVIYPEIEGPNLPFYLQDTPDKRNRWRPAVVNINDYNKDVCEKSSNKRCPDKDKLRETAIKYLQGDRLVMKFYPPEQGAMCPEWDGERIVRVKCLGYWN